MYRGVSRARTSPTGVRVKAHPGLSMVCSEKVFGNQACVSHTDAENLSGRWLVDRLAIALIDLTSFYLNLCSVWPMSIVL